MTLRDRKQIAWLMNCLEVLSVDEVVSRERLRCTTNLLNVNILLTRYRHAGNYRLNRQKQRREVERRGTSM